MSSGYTIYSTYQFEDASYSASTSYGYEDTLHCNYIKKIEASTLSGKALNIWFPTISDFIFLAGTGSTNGTGFTATKLNALIQVVSGITDSSGTTIIPDPTLWNKYDITSQIANHVVGEKIDKNNLINTLFTIDISVSGATYDLSYLSYPTELTADDEKLSFGEETFFFGTVRTDIKATVYTTDIPIVLSLNEYNSTTNPTWDGVSPVYVSEIGLYDAAGNQVAIGKLNFPLSKDSSIARTLLFGIDF